MTDILQPDVILALPSAPGPAERLAEMLGLPQLHVEHRSFPDGETYLRLPEVSGKRVLVVADLSDPNSKVLDLLFLARTARELGVAQITVLIPYLPYMRQDSSFKNGESVTSAHFAGILSETFDGLITVDPHLHRWPALSELFTIPTHVIKTAPLLARWAVDTAPDAIIAGPDEESGQWAHEVAREAELPCVVMAKERHGDYDVETAVPAGFDASGRQVILVDDIASTGRTLADATEQLYEAGAINVHCVVVHGLFVEDAVARIVEAGASRIACTNTVPHASSELDAVALIADAMRVPARV